MKLWYNEIIMNNAIYMKIIMTFSYLIVLTFLLTFLIVNFPHSYYLWRLLGISEWNYEWNYTNLFIFIKKKLQKCLSVYFYSKVKIL